MSVHKGKVKWFNEKKGFGFIIENDSSEEFFVHFREIQTSGFKTLKENQEVEFEITTGDKGKQATNVKPIVS